MKKTDGLWRKSFFVLFLISLLAVAIPALALADIDGDGISDSNDNCVFTINPDQLDVNLNNIGDVCEDNIAILSQAKNCTRLSSQTINDSSAQSCQDVTNIMENGPPFWNSPSSYIIRNKGKFDILSLRSETDSTQISSLTLSIWADVPNASWSSQNINVYAYDSDGDSVQTSNSLSFTINGNSVGWHVLDLTPLLSLMDGFGFVKFRLVNTNKELGIAEAYLRIPSPVNEPNISITPSSLDFGSIDVGASSSTSSLIVSNTGTADLVIGTITNPSSPYSITSDGCTGQTLAPAASCLLNVDFAPGTAGTFNDAITIPSNDPDSPNTTVSISGIATIPPLDGQEISVTPSTLDFGTVDVGVHSSLNISVSNIGTDNLTVGTITGPALPYTVTSDGCSGQALTPSATCSISVEFNSSVERTFNDSLIIPSDDADNPSVTVNLTATAAVPTLYETIKPTDAYNPDGWVNTSAGYDGNSDTYSYKITPEDRISVSFGGSASDDLVNAWENKTHYWTEAWLYVVMERISHGSSDQDDRANVQYAHRHQAPPGTKVWPVGIYYDKFEVQRSLNDMVNEWGDGFKDIANLRVRVDGKKVKSADGAESRIYDIRIIGKIGPHTPSDLTATAVSSDQIDLSWTDNASIETGFYIERKVNAGGTYSQIATVGANLTNYSDTGLSSGITYSYRVKAFSSSAESAYSNDAGAIINVPTIFVSPASLDFGTIETGEASTLNVSVSNTGSGNLIIGTITDPSSPYTITSDGCSGQTIIPTASCSVTVEFAPTAEGTFADAMSIPSNDTNNPNVTVNLDGTATAALDDQEISASPTLLDYENVDIGLTSSSGFTVSNIGTADLVLGTITNPSLPYSVTSDGCSGQTIIPSASCSVTVEFAPTAEGTFNDSITIPSNDADNPNVTVNLSGTAAIPNTIETIRPTAAYNPDGWTYTFMGYDVDIYSYTYKVTPNATPSISFGGSFSDETINAWQSKSNYWNAAWLSIIFQRGFANDDTVDVVVTDQNGNLKHSILSLSTGVSKDTFSKRLNMSDWGDGFSNIDNLRVRVNGDKNKGSDDAESRVYDVKIVGDSAPFVKDFTRGEYALLPVDDLNLVTDYVPDEIEDVESDDGIRVLQRATANQYPIHQFKFKATTQNVSVKWSGHTTQGFDAWAHSFVPNSTGSLNRVDIWLEKVGSPDGTLRARIKSELGGAVLAESNSIEETSVANFGSWKTFTFDTPAMVVAGDTYYLELWRDIGDSNNYIRLSTRRCDSDLSLWLLRGGNWEQDVLDNAFASSIYINGFINGTTSGCYRPVLDEISLYGMDWKNITIEAYNRITSSWDTLSTGLYDGSTNDITLSGNLFSSDYFDANNWVVVRAYAEPGANSFKLATDSIEITSLLDTWEISVVPASLAFGAIDVNTTSSSNLIVTNTGIGDLLIGTITNPSAPYSITSDGCSGQTLIASASCSVTVEFAPTVEDNFAGALIIPSNDADNPNATVNMIGTAVAATITGTLTDASSSQPLQGVTVTVTDSISSIHSDSTDASGNYTVSGLVSGNYTADYILTDYFSQTVNGTLGLGQTLTSDVQLSPVTLSISSPSDGAVLDSTPATVTGFVKSNSTVTVNGVPATVTGNDFSVVILLNEGQNIITAEATDQYSQTTYDSITVTFVPPITVTITSPQDGSVFNSSPITVTGNVYNNAGTGGYAEARGQSFKPMSSGPLNAIDLILSREGSAGGELYLSITTQLGGTPIAVSNMVSAMSVTEIQGGYKTFSFSTQPQVTAGNTYYMELRRTERDVDNYIDWWNIHGQYVLDYYPDGMGYRSDSGDWSDLGPYVDATFKVYVNGSLDIMQDYWTASSPHMVVYGIDPYPVDVTVNGITVTVTGNAFSASVPLSDGSNTITAVASDQFGHSSTDSIGVTLESKGSITGTVTNTYDGLPVDSADVSVTDSLSNILSTLTAADGTYTIDSIEPGAFNGSITKAGYVDYNFSGTALAGQTNTIDTALDPAPPVISNINVTNITDDSATITWTTDLSADSVVDYGTTASYGSVSSDPVLTTSHSITLTNLSQGTLYHCMVTSTTDKNVSVSSGDYTFTTTSPITITIVSPVDNDTINRADVMVRGTVTNSTGNETGVTVNGIVAVVYNGEFFANHVPLQDGQNTITVNAVDTADNTASHSILVDADTTMPHVTLRANIESGIAPLTSYFSVSTSIPNSVVTYDFDYEGDAIDDYTGTTFDDISVEFSTEGIYYPTITVTDDQSATYSDSIAIVVLNQNDLDTLLQAKWSAMKAALANQDVDTALGYFIEGSKERYRTIFEALINQLPVIMGTFVEFNIDDIYDNVVEYEVVADENGILYSYPGTFVKDANGIWKFNDF